MKKLPEVTAYTHTDKTRKTLPSGEQSGISQEQLGLGKPRTVVYPMEKEVAERNRDLDPQYVWRGKKDVLQVPAPILYQQERIYPKFLIDDMKRRTQSRQDKPTDRLTNWEDACEEVLEGNPEWYTHEEQWKNRLILGDSLQVMASLAENESLRGKVQMIYIDPPYGIKFTSNWQVSTDTTNVKDGKKEGLSTEPEMIKAFRDTWSDGVHTYLGYLRDRFVVARELLTQSGSIFVQIGDANVHKVRALLDEVFGEENFVSQITYVSTSSFTSSTLSNVTNHLLWFAKDKEYVKYHELYREKEFGGEGSSAYKKLELEDGTRISISQWEKDTGRKFSLADATKEHCRVLALDNATSQGKSEKSEEQPYRYNGKIFRPGKENHWKTNCPVGMNRLAIANRLDVSSRGKLGYVRYFNDFPLFSLSNVWSDTLGQNQFGGDKVYVCQTALSIIARCMLMTTDVGDLVLDPTCGSGTTAHVAEYWGRRWITVDTSRVALALARKRLMTAKYPYWKINGDSIADGFDYQRVAHITLKSIANNKHIDEIWEEYRAKSEALCAKLGIKEEWEAKELPPSETLAQLRELQRQRQEEMDFSIRNNADFEVLYDKPYEDKKRCRVAGPFTVESVSPVRALVPRDDGTTEDPQTKLSQELDPFGNTKDYVARMLEAIAKCGVKQARKNDRLTFSSVVPFPGKRIVAEALAETGDESGKAKRYAVAIGPEFGCITRNERNTCATEALEHNFDALLLCAFGFEAHADKDATFGKLRILNVRMNSDLHLAEDLKDTKNSNPFVLFGEPDIAINKQEDGRLVVEIKGVDVFDPKTQSVRSGGTDFISCWMLDTDYNETAFFARQVFFPNQKSYEALAKSLNKEVDHEEWEAVTSTTSHPFTKPANGTIAVKVINNFGDEVMKIYGDLP